MDSGMAGGPSRVAALVLAVAAMAAGSAAGQPAARPNTASAGDLSVLQIATTDPDALLAEWAKPTRGVRLTGSTRATRNQPIVTFIIFKGCKADASGACNLTADFTVTGPTGRVYSQEKAAKVWVGRRRPPNQALQLSESGLGLRFEDKDPLGPYRVRTTVTDHVAGVSLHTEQTLTAVAN